MSTPPEAPSPGTTPVPVSIERRRVILQEAINGYLRRGLVVVSQTDTTAQLVLRKHFSFGFALLWFLVFGIGLIVYLLYYAGKPDRYVYLTVDEGGQLQKRGVP